MITVATLGERAITRLRNSLRGAWQQGPSADLPGVYVEGLHELDTAEQSEDSSENQVDSFHLPLPPPIPGGLLRSQGKEG